MEARQIFREVQQKLDAADPRLGFHAVEVGVRQEEDWWYVPVVTEMKDGRAAPREFAIHILAGIETEMYNQHRVNVLLVPSSARVLTS